MILGNEGKHSELQGDRGAHHLLRKSEVLVMQDRKLKRDSYLLGKAQIHNKIKAELSITSQSFFT